MGRINRRLSRVWRFVGAAALLAFSGAVPASAGPVFEIVGLGTNGYATSAFWGISATGGGRMDGKIVFNDGFSYNPLGGTTFTAADIHSVNYSHSDPDPFDANTVLPTFVFSAGVGDILAASGTIGAAGNGIFGLSIRTSVPFALFALPYGLIDGTAAIDGVRGGIDDADDAPITELFLVELSTQASQWQHTGFETVTAVPEPVAALIFGLSLLGLGYRYRRT